MYWNAFIFWIYIYCSVKSIQHISVVLKICSSSLCSRMDSTKDEDKNMLLVFWVNSDETQTPVTTVITHTIKMLHLSHSGSDTCHVPGDRRHATHTRCGVNPPLITSLSLITSWHWGQECVSGEAGRRDGGGAGDGDGDGTGAEGGELLSEGERRGEISFRALRLPLPLTHAGHSD